MKIWPAIVVMSVIMTATDQAQATIITYYISGTTDPNSNVDNGFDGSTFSGSFSYDTDITGQTNVPGYPYGVTYNTGTIYLNSGPLSITETVKNGTNSGGLTNIQYDPRPYYANQFFIGAGATNSYSNGFGAYVDLAGASGALTSSDLPTTLDLSKFSTKSVEYRSTNLTSDNSYFEYNGTITSLSQTPPQIAAVPELSVWSMMIVGFSVIGFGMRRRKHSVLTYA